MLALADVARKNNFVRPELVAEPRLDIVGGRHPLQELCVDRFVPNDTHFGPECGVIKLLTGRSAFPSSSSLPGLLFKLILSSICRFKCR